MPACEVLRPSPTAFLRVVFLYKIEAGIAGMYNYFNLLGKRGNPRNPRTPAASSQRAASVRQLRLSTSFLKKTLIAPPRLSFPALRPTSGFFGALKRLAPPRLSLPNHRLTSALFFAFRPLAPPRLSLHTASHLDSPWLFCWTIFVDLDDLKLGISNI